MSKVGKKLLVILLLLILIAVLFDKWIVALFAIRRVLLLNHSIIVWIFYIVCIPIGFVLIKYISKIRARYMLFSIIPFLLFLFLLEGGVRVFVKNKKDVLTKSIGEASEKFGWKTKANFNKNGARKGYGRIEYSTTKYGFRIFGDVNTSKTKIFVIGDSFTQASTVSDGDTYYDYLKKHNNNIEIFAYGTSAYGSLNEYMILDEYYDMIKPHIILWQFCTNDFRNNSFELELYSLRQRGARHYYRDGKIEWLYPHSSWLYRNVLRHSYLLRSINDRLEIFMAVNINPMLSTFYSKDYPPLKKAVKTTSEIMGLVRKRAGNIPIAAFLACVGKKPFQKMGIEVVEDLFINISKENDLYYIPGVAKTVRKERESGLRVDGSPYNDHWNNVGHSIAGKIILDYLEKVVELAPNKSIISKEVNRRY